MDLFDCHLEFGRRAVPPLRFAADASAAVTLLRELGVARALAVHCSMHELHPAIGNARVVAETRGTPLEPTWALLPPCTGELGTTDAFLAGMRDAGVRAVWVYPRSGRFALTRATLEPLLSALVAHRVPLLLNMMSDGPTGVGWPELTAFLAECPAELRVLAIIHQFWGEDRYFRPLLAAHSGLHLGINAYLPADGIATLVRDYGAARFLYGSSYPEHQPGGSLLALLHAGLPDDATAAIAGGNLARLLSEVTL